MPTQNSFEVKMNDRSQQFIVAFTKEMISIKKKQHQEVIHKLREEQRIKKAAEIEKLKQKFDSYGEKPTEQPIKTEVIKQEQVTNIGPQFIPPPKTEEKKPQTNLPNLPKKITIKSTNLPITPIPIPAQPLAVQPGDINFGKIMFLIKDPLVTYIECPGEDKNIVIKRAGSTIKTQIILKEDEIKEIINSFSEKARIPLIEGMLNARVTSLEISAVIAEKIPSSFIIRRIVVDLAPKTTTNLDRPMIQFPQQGQQPRQMPLMPPIMRPYTPGASPSVSQQIPTAPPINPQMMRPPIQNQEPKQKENFFNRKITIG